MEKQAGVLNFEVPSTAEADETTEVLTAALRELAKGRIEALQTIWELLGQELYGLALWRTGSRSEAEDVVQEVFLRLARSQQDVSQVRRPRAYLLSIAHHAAVDVTRQRRGHLVLDTRFLVPETPDPARQAEAERASVLVSRLAPKQREAVFLRVFVDLSFREIARVTSVSTFTAASRYRLGIRRLRKWMGL